jgi:hypothetical protein
MPGNGGLLQLVAQGKQDVFLTGNPQITWFKMVYRRYTNFAVESQIMYFDGNPDFGKRVTCKVPVRGDLLGPIVMEVVLPKITLTDGTVVSYVNGTGFALLEELSLEIGEQEIDRQTGEWMYMWSKLSTPYGLQQGYNSMVGQVDGYNIPDTTKIVSQVTGSSVKLYIPLQFWFTKNPGLYLPLVAMQYHTVRVNIKLRSLQEMFYYQDISGNPATCGPTAVQAAQTSIIDMVLWGDYVYLDREERRRFVSNTHEYLIEQIQYTPSMGIPAGNTSGTFRLEFNHPIRELLWVVQRDVMRSYHEWFNYSSTAISDIGFRTDLLQDAVIQVDGYDRFDRRDAGYFRLVQPYQHHTNVPTNAFLYSYCFALRPEDMQPSGSLNASRIDNLVLQVNLVPDYVGPPTDVNYIPPKGNTHVVVYAINHNVLRVVNGFAGLLFRI